jgi:hypothetical protein
MSPQQPKFCLIRLHPKDPGGDVSKCVHDEYGESVREKYLSDGIETTD